VRRFGSICVALCCLALAGRAHAYGEAIAGFPNWSERVLLEWVNRARSAPQTDLAACSGSTCAEKACYTTASPPRYLDDNLEHSARFHSSHMSINSYFDHPSHCTLFSTIDSKYPASCGGNATCSCTQGALTATTSLWTDPFVRMGYFGANGGSSGQSEIIAAGYSGPDASFYGWLYEPTSSSACGFHSNDDNGHRYIILYNGYGELAGGGYVLGGAYGTYATMDFSGNAPSHPKIPSGSHYPQQAASVDAWANWYDTAGPSVHKIDVDGTCTDMSLSRGTQPNGAWHLSVGSVASGCHHYVFMFKDSTGKEVVYPTTGALTIGNSSAQCPDFSRAPPAGCAGFDRIFANAYEF
jgi:uncharacterized protein YkwD